MHYISAFFTCLLLNACLAHEWPDWERQRWLNHMNKRLNKASKAIIEEKVFSKASIEAYINLMTKHLKLPGTEFYREEFRYCDRNEDDLLSRVEILYCGNIATTLINRHLQRDLNDPDAYMPREHIFSINMTKLQVETQIRVWMVGILFRILYTIFQRKPILLTSRFSSHRSEFRTILQTQDLSSHDLRSSPILRTR